MPALPLRGAARQLPVVLPATATRPAVSPCSLRPFWHAHQAATGALHLLVKLIAHTPLAAGTARRGTTSSGTVGGQPGRKHTGLRAPQLVASLQKQGPLAWHRQARQHGLA